MARRVSRRPTRIRPRWTRKRFPDRSEPDYTHAPKRVRPDHLEMFAQDWSRDRGGPLVQNYGRLAEDTVPPPTPVEP